jgi:hypothetical protein
MHGRGGRLWLAAPLKKCKKKTKKRQKTVSLTNFYVTAPLPDKNLLEIC